MKEQLLNTQLKYFLYVRKSTDVEDKQVLSVAAQLVECQAPHIINTQSKPVRS